MAPRSGLWGVLDGVSTSILRSIDRMVFRFNGDATYPPEVDFCNVGADLSIRIPRPELVKKDGIEQGSKAWVRQMYGAALYYYMAATPGESAMPDPDLLRGKDVLEVGCMRGGGARYITQVAEPRRYVAIDSSAENVEACKKNYPAVPGLEYVCVREAELARLGDAESFDYVLGVESIDSIAVSDLVPFFQGCWHVLRPGGRIAFCDFMSRGKYVALVETLQATGFLVEVQIDLGRAVNAVGLMSVPAAMSYLRIVAVKAEVAAE